MSEALATKYRPHTWDDVTEQSTATTILRQQIASGEIQHAYLFIGSQGVGKTTIARIFANEINHGKGNPMELDAASNNSVDDVRVIIQQAKVQSMDSEYRIWIVDECHMLSNSAWNAMLKLLEEPPKKSVFIFCTTNAEKIPKTILSRVQRYDFKRISQEGIVNRLISILAWEQFITPNCALDRNIRPEVWEAVEYIAKQSEGGMRDAITLLDKCLAYSSELTIENVIQALGTVDYETFFVLSDAIHNKRADELITIIEKIHSDGKDLKQFVKDYMSFLLDINKYDILHNFDYLQLPITYKYALSNYGQEWFNTCRNLLPVVVKLNSDIKWDTQPKIQVESRLLGEIYG